MRANGVDGLAPLEGDGRLSGVGQCVSESRVGARQMNFVGRGVNDLVQFLFNSLKSRGDSGLRFSERVKNLTMYVFFASEKMIAEQPDTVRRFLVAWFETLDYVAAHKGETLQVAREVTSHDEDILSELYDLVLPLISRSGRFQQRSLDTLAESYVDLKLLPAKPEMARTYTEQFLPK